MANPSPSREGVLSTTTFPGLIYSILSRKETGVLTLTGDRICAMTRFENSVLPWFGLPRSLPDWPR